MTQFSSEYDLKPVIRTTEKSRKCLAKSWKVVCVAPLVVTEEIVVLKGASTLASHSKPRSYNHILHRRWFLQNINYILWCCKTWGVTNQWVGLQRLHPSFIYSVWHAHFALYSVWLWKRNRDWQSVNSKPKQWFYLSFVYIHQIVSLFMICLIKKKEILSTF